MLIFKKFQLNSSVWEAKYRIFQFSFYFYFYFVFPGFCEERETGVQSMLIKVSPLNGQKNAPLGHTYLSAVSSICQCDTIVPTLLISSGLLLKTPCWVSWGYISLAMIYLFSKYYPRKGMNGWNVSSEKRENKSWYLWFNFKGVKLIVKWVGVWVRGKKWDERVERALQWLLDRSIDTRRETIGTQLLSEGSSPTSCWIVRVFLANVVLESHYSVIRMITSALCRLEFSYLLENLCGAVKLWGNDTENKKSVGATWI